MAKLSPTLYLRAFGLLKVPLIFLVRPTVVDLNGTRSEVKIPLNYFTRNHWGTMYFGTLAIGADCAGGLIALDLIRKSGHEISIIFKDFRAEFLKRPAEDTHFICEEGAKVRKAIRQTIRTGKRVNVAVRMVATTPKISGKEPVAKFVLTMSLKRREK